MPDVNQFLVEMGRWVTTSGLRVVLVLLVALLLIKVTRLLLDQAFARLARRPESHALAHAETFKQILYHAIAGILLFTAVLLSLDSAGVNVSGESLLQTAIGRWIFTRGLKMLVVVALTFLAAKAFGLLLDLGFARLEKQHDGEMKKRTDTLKSVSRNVVNVSLICVAGIMVLGVLEIDVKPILATAGVLGVAVGFGAQQLVRDVINGFFILMDDQIRVGDVVEIAGKSGLVESVTLRMTVLRDLAGRVHYIRNGDITVVTNMTKEWSFAVFDVGVAYRENVDEVTGVLRQVAEELGRDPVMGGDILEPIEILGLDRFADSAVVIKARLKTKPICQWAVGREFNRRLKLAFDARGIEIPFPHLTLYMGQDKAGAAPPANVRVVAAGGAPGAGRGGADNA